MKFFQLINIKMPTIVGILIFISWKKIHAQLCCAGKKFKLCFFFKAEQISFSAELSKSFKPFSDEKDHQAFALSKN